MKKLIRFILIITFLTATLSPVYAKKMGTESGGGGGIAWLGLPYPVLMDYFTIIKSVDELPVSNETPSYIEEASSAPLLITQANKAEVREANSAFAKAIGILEQWEKLPFDIMSYTVLNAFNAPLRWNFTDKALSAPPFYFAPALPADIQTEVAARYSKNLITNTADVWISRSIWNKMRSYDQAGLLIHETLRQVQIGFGNDYNDETLQRATAIYLLCKPTGRLNYYMLYLLNNSPELADKIYGSFNSFTQKECRGIQ